MLILNSTQKLQVILGGAVTTNQCSIVASWADDNGTTLTSNSATLVTNGGTAVDVVPAPAASTFRQLKSFSLVNLDTQPVVVTIRLNVSATLYPLPSASLPVGYSILWLGDEFGVFAADGARVTSASSGTAVWGSITGTLSNQTDLQAALDGKISTTLGAFGSSPDAKGASVSGQTLTLQPADGTHPGLMSTGSQTFGGAKTWSNTQTFTLAPVFTDAPGTRTALSLNNVTNDAQTKAAIVPNTAPSAGQLLAGNAGGTAYAPVSLSGSGATFSLSSAGVLSVSGIANASLSNSSITIGGTSTALGGSVLGNVTNDTQTKAAIVPNTVPSAGQIHVGNAGGTAFAAVSMSGDVTIDSTGATSIGAGKVTLAQQVNAAASSIRGNNTGSPATPADLTVTQVNALLQGDGLTSKQAGFRNIPQNIQSADYTTVAADSGGQIFHPSADTTARTFTIDSNANVAYPIGTTITFINEHLAGTLTIAITSDTMRMAGTGTTGSRTLLTDNIATAVKVKATEWYISGTSGLS